MNKLILSGRPTREPVISYSASEGEKQKVVARFMMASNKIFVREGEASADFIPCVAFGKPAKFIEEYVKKGMLLLVTGALRNNDYVNKDGVKVYGFQLVVDTVEILEKKNENAQPAPTVDENGYMHMTDEEMADMPFG